VVGVGAKAPSYLKLGRGSCTNRNFPSSNFEEESFLLANLVLKFEEEIQDNQNRENREALSALQKSGITQSQCPEDSPPFERTSMGEWR
jgi:hypothetical protein